MQLLNNQITNVSLELTGICNLSCKLCAKNYNNNVYVKKNILTLQQYITLLNKYTNLKTVFLAGFISEPTLYPYLFELLMYLKKRNIAIELYTNGNTHDEKWWKELAKYLTKNDKVIFTICGSTQELHEKYRVGSSLQQILQHLKTFKNINKNDYCQFIRFEYNKDDLNSGKMNKIFKLFSNYIVINSLPYYERFITNNIFLNDKICMPFNLQKLYYSFLNLYKMHNNKIIICKSLDEKFIWLDQFGNEWPCFIAIINNIVFNKNNYTNIINGKYDFCYECSTFFRQKISDLNLEII